MEQISTLRPIWRWWHLLIPTTGTGGKAGCDKVYTEMPTDRMFSPPDKYIFHLQLFSLCHVRRFKTQPFNTSNLVKHLRNCNPNTTVLKPNDQRSIVSRVIFQETVLWKLFDKNVSVLNGHTNENSVQPFHFKTINEVSVSSITFIV